MRALTLVVIAACSTTDPGPSPLSFIPPLPHPTRSPPPRPVPAPAPPPAIRGIHGAAISQLAVLEDGTAAVTADGVGGIRLWPALDASREPIVVHAPAPAQLAISRAGDELGVAILDEAGALTVVRFDREGRVLGRAQLAAAAEVDQVIGTPHGFLAVTTDEAIELVSLRATRLAHLSPAHRITAVLYRHDRALVLREAPNHHVVGRWLELAGEARWGDETPELAIAPDLAVRGALAPDHAHVVFPHDPKAMVLDLATSAQRSLGEGFAAGFVDATTVLVRTDSGIELRDLTGKRIGRLRDPEHDPDAVADGMFVWAHAASLVLATPTETHYLGYASTGVATAEISALGTVLSTRGHFLVDETLALGDKLGANVAGLLDVLPVGAHHVATLVRRGEEDATFALSIDRKVTIDDAREATIHFDPKTHLLAIATAGTTTFLEIGERVGPKRILATSSSPLTRYFVDTSEAADRIFLTDPDLAAGRVAFVVHGSVVREIAALAAAIKPAKTYQVGAIAAIDRAGRIYTHTSHRDVAIHGSIVTFPDTASATTVVPSPDAKLIAITGDTIALYSPAGQLRWRVPARGLGVQWDAHGQLLAVGLPGVATFDLDTGELARRRCGWGFALSAKPLDAATASPTVCDL
ncbi:MAG: hypothetical protein ABI678_03115 [Kofleriaceae bacterium]